VLTETSNLWSLTVPVGDSVPLSHARPLTTGNQLIEGVGAISPDGAWLYYHSDRSGSADLWRAPVAGGSHERLTTDSAPDFAPALSPDGRQLAFHSLRTGSRQIFVMPASGGMAVQVSANAGQESVPAWSPEGRALIWLNGDTIRVSRQTRDGRWGVPEVLTAFVPAGGWACWSPDGRWISYPAPGGLLLFDPITKEHRLLPEGHGITWHAWSADSRTIYGIERHSRALRILALPVTGGQPRVLAYADAPLTQEPWYGLVFRAGQLYFTLGEAKADVWVGDVDRR
jgi:hypothetical protein